MEGGTALPRRSNSFIHMYMDGIIYMFYYPCTSMRAQQPRTGISCSYTQIFLFSLYDCFACMSVCGPRECPVSCQKRASDPLVLEFQVVMNYHEGTGPKCGCSVTARSVLCHRAISPAPNIVLLNSIPNHVVAPK